MVYDCLLGRGHARGMVYMYDTRKSNRGGEKAKIEGECGSVATMTKECLLNCSQVQDIEREGEEEAERFDSKG